MTRVGSSAIRLFHRYQTFFFVSIFLVTIQLYMGYTFYRVNQEDLRKLEEEWKKKHTHDSATKRQSFLLEKPPDGEKIMFQNQLKPLNTINYDKGSEHSSYQRFGQPNVLPDADVLQPARPNNSAAKGAADGERLRSVFQPKCVITEEQHKDAYSAIQRATSVQCKQEIADVVCLQREGRLFAQKELPNYCPLRTKTRGKHVGCYQDSPKHRILPDMLKSFTDDNSINKCILTCLQAGYEYAGMEWGKECFCSENFKKQEATSLPPEQCNTPCPGDRTSTCGGYNAVSIYMTGAGVRKYTYPSLVDPADVPSDMPKARIVFILSLNGRALRQVVRLIKAIYHRDHYILIHVDSRQEYLFRELSRITANYSNIRMMPYRYATMWGGANLTTMLLKCFEFLFSMMDWTWDFIINLSESDYPVRPVDQLIAFLTMNKGLNFLKSHGKDTSRFIQKQGLEHTFVQCDNHMWRVSQRKLPQGIRIDGGSDWVALNREFCHYLLTSSDEMIRGLREYWKYTLLPGESFWHTVLQNSHFCTTFGNNNLHVVNWIRKKGCKCQYKAIVDWCGCSPNDFLDGDMQKIMNLHQKKKVVFFARKFEAIVNQDIINQLDAFLYGSYPEGMPGLASYWENVYTWEDRTVKLSDTDLTFYKTFARGALSYLVQITGDVHCSMKAMDVIEVNVLKQADVFQGLLVKFTAEYPSSRMAYILEALLQYKPMLQLHGTGEAVTRLKNIEVGINFDVKEEMFRSFGNLIGPDSVFTVALYWESGPALQVTISVIDPAQIIAMSFTISITNNKYALPLVMDLERPLRPGIWTVKLQHNWNIIAEAHFLVTPYSHYGGRPITDDEARMLHKGPSNGYQNGKLLGNIAASLDLDDPKLAGFVASKNSLKTGDDLIEWIDDLTFKFWTVGELCSATASLPCTGLQTCNTTTWSSLSPDPKSQLGQVNPLTGRLR